MPHETSGKTFNERREFPFSRRILRDFSTPRHCVGKSPLKSFQFCILQNRNREGKRKEKPRSSSRFPSPFRRCSVAAVCHFRGVSYGWSSSQQTTPTSRRRAQSRLLELERRVAINGRIPMTIAPGAEKPSSPHAVHFSQAIGMCVRKTFFVRCLKWADVGREYIERLFVLDFNDQAMNRFVEHQMLTIFKEFRADCQRNFKKYSYPKEARANPPNALEQSQTNKAARQKQPYNHSSGSKSFLQRQYELAERREQPVYRVELFRETHVRAETFVSQAAEDAHNQMLELQSQPTPEGSQPLSENEICDQVLGRRPCYLKGLGWGPKPKARRTASASSSSTSCSQSTEKEIELQAKLHEALERIEVQDRNHQALASQVEAMKKMIEELTRAQQGPPYDP
ncbi:CACTA en-spm transposon protein [Cucumis melo var. makuwa]|uniref:CACTA en-spm transposon protein n=1 Tax=Cucumis melo var. makuwa TaxID=1194695 RepID=A0A5A7UW63_CUCMM|nr:CACTA en-spm transposon protein [Cucumis melo var. makuwa]